MISALGRSWALALFVCGACAAPDAALPPTAAQAPCTPLPDPAAALPGEWSGNALHQAIRAANVAAAGQAIDNRADLDQTDSHGNTPLIAALTPSQLLEPLTAGQDRARAAIAREGRARIAIVNRLLAAGANPNAAGAYGATALTTLAQWGFSTADDVRLAGDLMRRGARVDAQDQAGDTALIIAARRGKREVVEALLKGGASRTVQNCQGQTAAAAAARGRQDAIAQLLTR